MSRKRSAKFISALHNPTSKGIWSLSEQYQKIGSDAWDFDPYWGNVSVLLHGEGVNNSTTFTDSSLNNLSITRTGTPVISTTRFKYGSASIYCTGTSQYLNIPSDYSSVAFGTGDFTVELWSYLETAVTGYQFLFNITHTNGNLDIRYGDGGFGNKLQVGVNTNSTSTTYSTSATKTTHTDLWKHIAFTRSGSTCRLFVDGTLQSINSGVNPSTYPLTSFTSSVNVTGVTASVIGGQSTHVSDVYVDDFRVTKGVARYTASFTAPTKQFPDL